MISNACPPKLAKLCLGSWSRRCAVSSLPNTDVSRGLLWGCQLGEAGGSPLLPKKKVLGSRATGVLGKVSEPHGSWRNDFNVGEELRRNNVRT